MMKKRTILLFGTGAGIICAITFTFVLRGTYHHFFFSIGVGSLASGLFLVLGLLTMLIGRFWSPSRWISTVSFALLTVALIQMISFPAGRTFFLEKDIKNAKEYCESHIPALEAHKQKFGSYPENLDYIIPEDNRLPHLLGAFGHGPCGYISKGDTFHFGFVAPDRPAASYEYWSETQEWRLAIW